MPRSVESVRQHRPTQLDICLDSRSPHGLLSLNFGAESSGCCGSEDPKLLSLPELRDGNERLNVATQEATARSELQM